MSNLQFFNAIADLKAAPVSLGAAVYDSAVFAWRTGDFTGQADSANIIESYNAALTVGAWVRQSAEELRTTGTETLADFLEYQSANEVFLKAQPDAADQTALVQAAVDTIGDNVTLRIRPGVKFRLKDLLRLDRVRLQFRFDDDRQLGTPSSRRASGEVVDFLSTSDKLDGGITGGAVNEWQFKSPFHPGIVCGVDKRITGAQPYLTTGTQTLDNPTRASFNLADEDSVTFRILSESYAKKFDPLSGTRMHAVQIKLELANVGTTGWTTPPGIHHLIKGATTGALGFVKKIENDKLTLEWVSGRFNDEYLIDTGLNGAGTVTSNVKTQTSDMTAPIDTETAGISFASYTGAVSVGDGPYGRDIFNVFGGMTVLPSRDSSLVQAKKHVAPIVAFARDADVYTSRVSIQCNPLEKTDSTRRLSMARGAVDAVGKESDTFAGEFVPVAMMAQMRAASATVVDSDWSTNVDSIGNPSTGVYHIFSKAPFARPNTLAMVQLHGSGAIGWRAIVTGFSTTGYAVEVRNCCGMLANLPAESSLHVLALGGDC